MGVSGHLLVVEDDPVFSRVLTRGLRARGFSVTHAVRGDQAMRAAAAESPVGVVLDLCLAGVSALPMIAPLCCLEPSPRICVLTGFASIQTAVEAIKLGARHYLAKPAHVDEVLAALGLNGPDIAVPTSGDAPARAALGDLGWQHILRTLRETNGNVSRTARLLHMHRRTLTRRIAARRDAELEALLDRFRACSEGAG